MGLRRFRVACITLFVLSLQSMVDCNKTKDIDIIHLNSQLSSQSSTNLKGFGPADKAVDGNTNGNLGGGSCAQTEHEYLPWWMVDLNDTKCVGKVEIFNQMLDNVDRLEGAIVRVGPNSNRNNSACGNISLEQIHANQQINLTCDMYGQYLSIELPITKFLTLCEVRAYRGQCQEQLGSSTTNVTQAPYTSIEISTTMMSPSNQIENTTCSFVSNPNDDNNQAATGFVEMQDQPRCLKEFLKKVATLGFSYPDVQGNTTKIETEYYDVHIFDNSQSVDGFGDVHISAQNTSYALEFASDALNTTAGLSLVLYVLKSNFQPQRLNDRLGNVFNIGSRIISINLFRNKQYFPYIPGKVFNITFSVLPDVTGNPSCQFVTQSGSWSNDGCFVSAFNDSHVTCTCNHLTSFAVLMKLVDVTIPEAHDRTLKYLTYIVMSISITCLIATLTLYAMAKLYKDTRIAIHANLAASLLLAQLVFLTGIDAKAKAACIAVTVMLHYLWLVVFMWMLMEGIYLYLKVKPHITWTMKILVCMSVAWGAPILIVLTTLGIGFTEYAGENKPCWLPTVDGLIYAFAVPAFTTTLINAILLVIILRKFLALKTNQDKSKYERIKASVRAVVILMPLLGVTWLFGVLQFDLTSSLVFGYLFIICNGLQGPFFFITQCLLDDDVKAFLRQKSVRGRVEHSCDTENTN